MAKIKFEFNQGYVSARDETELQAGELVSGVGAYYEPGDPVRIWKEPGRQEYHAFSGTDPIKGIALCLFDNARVDITRSGIQSDKLFAYISDRLDWVDPIVGSVSGTLVSGVTPSGLVDTTSDNLFSVHYDDAWYLSTVNDRPYAIEANTLQSPRLMGMLPPQIKPVVSAAAAATITLRPQEAVAENWWWRQAVSIGASSFDIGFNRYQYTYPSVSWLGTFTDTSNASDTSLTTFAYASIGPGDKAARIAEFRDFPQNNGNDRFLKIVYQIVPGGGDDPGGSDIGVGVGLGTNGVIVRMELELEKDFYVPDPEFDPNSGSTLPLLVPFGAAAYYNLDPNKGRRIMYQRFFQSTPQTQTITESLPDGFEISGNMRLNVSIQTPRWSWPSVPSLGIPDFNGVNPTVLRIHDIRVVDGTSVLNQSASTGGVSGVRYAVSEYDSERDLYSVPGPQSDSLVFEDRLGATFNLPSGLQNANTTHHAVFRSNLPGGEPGSGIPDAWNHFGQIDLVPVEVSGAADRPYLDEFDVPITATPAPLVPTIAITADDGSLNYKLRDRVPPPMRAMTLFRGSVVGISAADPRTLVYSYAGFPESYPSINVIDAFPLPERDALVAPVPLDNTLVVLAEGAVLTMTELPHVRQGRLVASKIDVIEGAPGCASEYGYTSCEWDGFPVVAYVSIHGVYITDGHSANRISDDLDWEAEVNRSTLHSSALFFDRDKKHLIFLFDQSGDGVNDTKFIFHLAGEHRKQNGMPRVLGPTPAKLVDMVQGQIDDEYRIFSARTVAPKVYRERVGTADESGSRSHATSGVVPFDIKTGRMYGEWEYLSAIRGNLRHTDWGTGETITLNWTAGRDDGDQSDTVTKSVSVASNKGDEVFIGRHGEYHQVEMTNFTSGTAGGVHHLHVKVQKHGSDSGDV